MRFTSAAIAIVALVSASTASAQGGRNPERDTAWAKYADSRQHAGEPKGFEKKRNTRCKIVVRKGQDKHVCGVRSNMSPGNGRRQ